MCAPDSAQARALPVTEADEVWELGTLAGLTDGDPFGAHRVGRLVVRRGEEVLKKLPPFDQLRPSSLSQAPKERSNRSQGF